jgi:UDP-N-acetylmuramoyl-tripeptide--D-alanyl-D-alanine ligase
LRVLRNAGLAGWELSWKGRDFRFPLAGEHNLANARAAVALAVALGLEDSAVARGLAGAQGLFGRTEIVERDGITVVRDCYNSSPESAEEIIGLCDSLEWQGRRIYVLGAMLEQGKESKAAHERLGGLLANSKADTVFLIGEETRPVFEKLGAVVSRFPFSFFDDVKSLKKHLEGVLQKGDLV